MGDGRLLFVVVGEKMSFDEAGPHEAVDFVPVQGNGECLRVIEAYAKAYDQGREERRKRGNEASIIGAPFP